MYGVTSFGINVGMLLKTAIEGPYEIRRIRLCDSNVQTTYPICITPRYTRLALHYVILFFSYYDLF
jgi:hypothetical protein